MAGGKGERLRPLTNSIPKPLLRIGTYSLIEKLLYGLAKQKIRNIFIAVHYQKDLFFETLGNGERFGVNIEYLIEPEPMGTAGAITMLPNPSEIENLLVTNADLIHNIDYAQMLRFHLSESSDMTVASTFFSTEIPYGVLKSQDRDLIKIEEKPTFNFPIMCGVNIISNRILREYRSTTKLNMVEVIERAIASKRKVKIYDIDTYWVDIGDRGTFDRELSYFENGLPNK
jgi:NDP-sugar pyrophosphorylase family protein